MSLVQAIRPFLAERRFIGLLRYKLGPDGRLEKVSLGQTILQSIPFLILTIFLLYTQIALTLSGENRVSFFYDFLFGSGKLLDFVGRLITILLYLSMISCFILSLVNNQLELDFYNELVELDKRLDEQLNIIVDYKLVRRNIWITYAMKLMYLINILSNLLSPSHAAKSVLFKTFLWGISGVKYFLVTDFYAFYVCADLLNHRVILIRKSLEDGKIENFQKMALLQLEFLSVCKLKNMLEAMWGPKCLISVTRDFSISTMNVFSQFTVSRSGEIIALFAIMLFNDDIYNVYVIAKKCKSISIEVHFRFNW